ncbi:EpsD family peptidyl-prolyl cis-trans isomerase [Curvibacter sp. APW13]|uniref:EpsD family peptidyl-prolyl cis-trans isomerase n=1 Tax=Curvibacter sp. APW13 TaxID=3077236 RepID=UPI0028DE56FE|nr:EpsD family peptidyl-prolyl cis-trans isomerase [Curvibacter sp. APW13]MDT8992586.1 EpsD family peptidyl-prolyl cis-trans isomerase [Curvibacter sp. APW13]
MSNTMTISLPTHSPRAHSGGISYWMLASVATTLLMLTACGDKESPKAVTQVAAKVGNDEISVHQINDALSRRNTQGASKQEISAFSKSILEKLIDQQLALNQAIEAKLNRSPEVVTQIESARREILAAAWVKQLAGTLPRPTEAEARQYFADHPYLFSQRKIFHIQEIVTSKTSGLADELREYTKAGKSIQDAATFLKSRNIAFTGGEATRAAEQIPLESLAQISELKDGQTTLIDTPMTLTLMRLVASEASPVSEALALPRITQFMLNQRINSAVASNLKDKRSTTKVEYLGEFANIDSGLPDVGRVALTTPIESGQVPAGISGKAKEKGVAGLK